MDREERNAAIIAPFAKREREKQRALERGAKRVIQQRRRIRRRSSANYIDADKAARRRLWRNQRLTKPWQHIVKQARFKSRTKQIEYDLTDEWAIARWTGYCELSGLPFEIGRTMIGVYSPSIDRIEASKGYTQANCRFILAGLNNLKLNGTDRDVRAIVIALFNRLTPDL